MLITILLIFTITIVAAGVKIWLDHNEIKKLKFSNRYLKSIVKGYQEVYNQSGGNG